jgi:tyrosyl-tRNA synthetase
MTTANNSIFRPADEQLAVLRRGAAEIIPEDEFRAKLEKSRAAGKPLRVYLGVDPTAPDLHLGHTVVLRKLKHFQDEGHTAIFLIGDFSAMIGDPTGQSETRPPLSRAQVDANAKTYLEQVYKILDPHRTEVRHNSEWLGKMSSQEVVQLCGKYRLARMLEREDFRSRLAASQPISVHELLYPLLTAYDAVSLQADVELGATEQKFNLLVHREIQREYGQPPEAVLTMPILVGTDGERKMSKSLGNYIGIADPPSQMFGKIMSISDDLMWSYYELVTNFSSPVIVRLKEEVRTGVLHPKKAKIQLAHSIVANFHGEEAAKEAADRFDLVYSQHEAPPREQMEQYPVGQEDFGEGTVRLTRLLQKYAGVSSRSEAERLIRQGAVAVDDTTVRDPAFKFDLTTPRTYQLWVGKKQPFLVVIK